MDAEFQVGDLVKLNSGGRVMTVETIEGDAANVVWMRENGEMEEATVKVAVLRPHEPRNPGRNRLE